MNPTVVPRGPLAPDDPLTRLPTDVDLARDRNAALAGMPTDLDLPYSDGEPMDSQWHRAAITLLIDSLEYHWRDRHDFFVGGDMFVYFSRQHVFHKDFRGPDFFVVDGGVERGEPRRSWVAWQEGGRLPDVIIELASESTVAVDRGEKRRLYGETFRTAEYYIYDPSTHTLEGWRLRKVRYGKPEEPDADGRIWSPRLGLFVGPWDGIVQDVAARWPRFFTADGRLVPTGREAEYERAEQERQRAEHERQRADAAEAELARLRAELAALKQPPTQP